MKFSPLVLLALLTACGEAPSHSNTSSTVTPSNIPGAVLEDVELATGTGSDLVALDASSSTAALYLNFEEGTLKTSTQDAGWDLSIKRTSFQTNSGSSGSGTVGVVSTELTDFAAVTSCSTEGLTYDAVLPASGAPGSVASSGNAVLNAWYNYNMTTHQVSSKQLVYVLTDGSDCFKFQIVSYASGKYEARVAALPLEAPASEVIEQDIDASSSAAAVYLSLEAGKLVSSTVEGNWLLSVKRTSFQTNSGSSGTGSAGVALAGTTDFDAVTSCADLSFEADAVLPASGAPGSAASSGSAILNAWYNYDMSTHQVLSKGDVYAITDGEQCVKLQILNYKSGLFTVKYSVLN